LDANLEDPNYEEADDLLARLKAEFSDVSELEYITVET
jgi:hypothetical protein